MKKIFILFYLISNQISAQINIPIQKQINGNELFATLNTSQNDFHQAGTFSKHGLSESSFIKNEPSLLYKSFFGFSCINSITKDRFTTANLSSNYIGRGPIYMTSYTPTEEDQINYKRMWEVNSHEINMHKKDFLDNKVDIKINSIYAWPGKGNPYFKEYNGFELVSNYEYAPFKDVNKDGIYNPDHGDYPHLNTLDESIIPKVIAWRIENYVDPPFKFELRSSFWQLACKEIAPLNRTVFCSMELINRSPLKLNDLKIFISNDSDLGCHTDDYFGTDSSRNSIYYYNADDNDGEGLTGLCEQNVVTYNKPPVLSLIYLNRKLDASIGIYGNKPYSIDRYLTNNYSVEKIYKNERTGEKTNYEFSENPNVKGSWSMHQFNYSPTDIKTLSIHQHSELDQNEKLTFDYAYLLTKDNSRNHLEMVDIALNEIELVQKSYSAKFVKLCKVEECEGDCVWPGDTNNDGVVNYLDAVNIFYGFNQNGIKRIEPLYWNGLFSMNWNTDLPTKFNTKYADANGDSLINISDLDAVTKYYGFSHGANPLDTKSCEVNSSSKFNLKDLRIIGKGSAVRFNLILDTKEEEFQGISFEVDIESGNYSRTMISNSKIWIDTAVKVRSYSENVSQALNHQGEKAVYFNDQQSDKKKHTEIKWIVVMNEDTVKNLLNLPYSVIRICNGKLYKNNGEVILIASDTIHVPNSKFVSTQNVSIEEISFYPNPANDQIQFTHPEIIKTIRIYNLQGQLVKIDNTNFVESKISTEDLNSGMYLLELVTKEGRLIKKLSVNK